MSAGGARGGAAVGEPEVDAHLAAEHGLSAAEYERLTGFLGRTPKIGRAHV